MHSCRCRLLLLLATALCCVLCARADDSVERAKRYLDQNKPQAAYDLLAPQQSERAGDPEYDYLLGVAALDIGRNTEAVFALERVLAVQPDHAPARAQIARAYFALKETETAKREFENLKQQDLPPNVRASIDRYLDAIDRVAQADKFKARFFLEFALGWDSNVNSATQLEQIAVPAFSGVLFTLAPSSVRQHDGFFSAAAGISITNPLSPGLALIGGISTSKRFNFTQSGFDTGYMDGYFGVARKLQRDTWSLIGQGNLFLVDDPSYPTEFRDAIGATLQWTHDYNARNQVTAYLQYASLTYPSQASRDADRYIAGAGYAHAFRGGDPIVYAGIYGGLEETKDGASRELGHRPLGLRAGGQKALSENWLAFVSLAAEWRRYRGTDPWFFVVRDDKQYSAGVGLTWSLPHDWKLSPQVTYLRNTSNIELNRYDRTQAFISLRRDF